MTNHATPSRLRVVGAMLQLAWQVDRTAATLSFLLAGMQAITQSAYGLWLKLIVDGVSHHDLSVVSIGAGGAALTISASVSISYGGQRAQSRLRDRTRYAMNKQVLDLVAATPTLELHENPRYLNQLHTFQREGHQLSQVLPRMVELSTITVQVITTAALMVLVDPLLLALPIFAVPSLLVGFKTGRLFREGSENAAEPARVAEHLVEVTATPGGAKEVRLFRLQAEILNRFHQSHHQIQRIHGHAQVTAAVWSLAARLTFVGGYVAAITYVTWRTTVGDSTIGEAALIAVLAGQVLGLVGGSSEILQLTIRSLVAAARFVSLQRLFRQEDFKHGSDHRPPERLTRGISLRNVSYQYRGANRPAFEGIDLDLAAGSTVAIVGDNGAGKSTLVKLLAGLYRPSHGIITIDGTDLASIDLKRWHDRVSAAFQDHARFELLVRETVALGDIDALAEDGIDQKVVAAIERAAADDTLSALPRGLDTQLGSSWPAGIDLSGGEWQKLAISRAMMRPAPALLLLDEPSAALDPETESRLFDAWTRAARDLRLQTGSITIVVSHRFSTVRMADTIIVLDKGTVTEQGSHDELMSASGLYAELFRLQAAGYQ